MRKLDAVFEGVVQPGIYRYAPWVLPEVIMDRVAKRGWRGFHIDGREISDKPSFLYTFAKALSFPDYFGYNWDAFEDSITDMAWLPAPGYVLLYDHVRCFSKASPEDWAMAQKILEQAVHYWNLKRTPMYVLLRKTERRAMRFAWIG